MQIFAPAVVQTKANTRKHTRKVLQYEVTDVPGRFTHSDTHTPTHAPTHPRAHAPMHARTHARTLVKKRPGRTLKRSYAQSPLSGAHAALHSSKAFLPESFFLHLFSGFFPTQRQLCFDLPSCFQVFESEHRLLRPSSPPLLPSLQTRPNLSMPSDLPPSRS